MPKKEGTAGQIKGTLGQEKVTNGQKKEQLGQKTGQKQRCSWRGIAEYQKYPNQVP